MVMDYVRNRAFTLFDDSAAAQRDESPDENTKFDNAESLRPRHPRNPLVGRHESSEPNCAATVVITGASSGIGTQLARARRAADIRWYSPPGGERLVELADELREEHSVTMEVIPVDLATKRRAPNFDRVCRAGRRSVQQCGIRHQRAVPPPAGAKWSARRSLSTRSHSWNSPMRPYRGWSTVVPAPCSTSPRSLDFNRYLAWLRVLGDQNAFVQTFSEAVHEELHDTGVSCTVLCPGPVPTEWADVADARQFSIPIAQVSPGEVAEAAIVGMLEGKRSVVPGIVPNIVGLAGRFTPRSALLPALRLFNAPRR